MNIRIVQRFRSYVGSLASQGITYVAQYMPLADCQIIINTPMKKGVKRSAGGNCRLCKPTGAMSGKLDVAQSLATV